jgi:hypothetical protein
LFISIGAIVLMFSIAPFIQLYELDRFRLEIGADRSPAIRRLLRLSIPFSFGRAAIE